MCGICGCGQEHKDGTGKFKPVSGHVHPVLNTGHHHEHLDTTRLVQVEQDLLSKNNAYAAQNRRFFQAEHIFVLNLVSSPGAGKTTLLVETIKRLLGRFPIAVIEGDQQTEHDADKIRGLGVGADDYMTKPFNTDELIARIRSHLRRFAWGGASEQRVLNFGDLSIDILKRTVRISGKNIDLTTKEFAILQLLAANPGRAFTREELLRQIWGYEHYGGVRNVDVHIKRLRAKIEKDPISPEYLMTAWGIGYKFREAL